MTTISSPTSPDGAPSVSSVGPRSVAAARGVGVLTPVALTLWMAFSRGGYFVGDTAHAAIVACAVLFLWVMLAPAPLAGLRVAGGIALGALALLAVWTLVSSGWSGAGARALIEFDRLLLYLVVFALAVVVPGRGETVRWLLRALAAALVIVCLAGLASRLAPGLVDSAPAAQAAERLIWPVGYWNGLGLAAAMALILLLHLASDLREPLAVRVIAAMCAAPVAATLYLTLSRGGFVSAAVGLIVLVALARGAGMPGALVAFAPAVAGALLAAASAEALTSGYAPDSAASDDAARSLGMALAMLALGAGLLRLVVTPLDRRLARIEWRRWSRRRMAAVTMAVIVVGAVAVAVTGADSRLSSEWREFRASAPVENQGGGRLLSTSANGRIEHWNVAWQAFKAEPLHGNGAGTYAHDWAQRRAVPFSVQEGHSLYLEMLSELGVVGLGLLAIALLLPLALCVRRRREDRVLWSAVVAVSGTFLLHAGIDWDWELPAITIGVLALLGTACAGSEASPARGGLRGRVARIVTGLAILLLMLNPLRAAASQRALDDALAAFRAGDCPRAIDRALDAQSALGTRPEPLEIIGYCDTRLGQPALAEKMLRAAVDRDPRNWELRYGLAIVLGSAGEDPRPALREALTRNPREPLVRSALERMESGNPRVWRRESDASPVIIPQPIDERAVATNDEGRP